MFKLKSILGILNSTSFENLKVVEDRDSNEILYLFARRINTITINKQLENIKAPK